MSDALDFPLSGGLVVDANVLVNAAPHWLSVRDWPKTPPDQTPAEACVIGIAWDADEWQLWLSPALTRITRRVLVGDLGDQFRRRPLSAGAADAYLDELDWIATSSGGGCINPRSRVEAIGDPEDDRNVLSLAASIPAFVIISWDRLVVEHGKRSLPTSEGERDFWFLTPNDFVKTVNERRGAQGQSRSG